MNNLTEERLFAASYDRVLPWLESLRPEDLEPVNLDITSAVATVLGALPGIVAIRSQITVELPQFDATLIDRLGDVARAASYTHTQFLAACSPPDDLPRLYEEGVALRSTLRGDAEQLARRELVNAQALDDLSGGTGYKNLARDLQILVYVVRESWPAVQGKCAVELSELDRAERVAEQVLSAVGGRDQASAPPSDVAERRVRAFTLLVRSYSRVRRAVAYLRWEDNDADFIAPSLYAGRGGRTKGTATDPQASDDAAVAPPGAGVAVPVLDADDVTEPTLPGTNPFLPAK